MTDQKISNQEEDLEIFNSRSRNGENLPVEQDSTSALITAMQKGYEPALIEKMMDLQERYEKREAEKLFNKSVAQFKLKPIEIIKDKYNDQTKSKYVSAGQLLGAVNPELAIYELSARFKIDDKTNKDLITVACVLSHSSGHSIEAEMSSPPDTKGPQGTANKTEIHGRISALTYLMKATYGAVVGVAAIDDKFDDNGNAAGAAFIDEKQLSQIVDMLNDLSEKGKKEAQASMLKFAGAENMRVIPKAKFADIVTALAKRKEIEKEKQEGK